MRLALAVRPASVLELGRGPVLLDVLPVAFGDFATYFRARPDAQQAVLCVGVVPGNILLAELVRWRGRAARIGVAIIVGVGAVRFGGDQPCDVLFERGAIFVAVVNRQRRRPQAVGVGDWLLNVFPGRREVQR